MAEKHKDWDSAKTAVIKEDPPPPPEERVVVGFYFPYSVFPTLYLYDLVKFVIYFQV